MTATDDRELSALDMARNLMRSVESIARYVDTDDPEAQIQAHIRQLGPQQHAAAQMAAHLALVSIAEDLHRIVGIVTGDRGLIDDPDDDATRDHMRNWADGTDTHQGET